MHYVCSDIHGQYDYFIDILEKINFSDDDHMYVIGDVIDRGPDSIKLLQYILNKENMTLLIGNHEHLMIQALLFNNPEQLSLWMYNGGEKTLEQYEQLSDSEQKDILIKLFQSPLIIPNLEVEDKKFYLVHASHSTRILDEPVLYCNSSKEEIERAVWNREYQNPNPQLLAERFNGLYANYKDTKLIIGHSPVYVCSYRKMKANGQPMISRSCSGHLINVDCGAARGLPIGCLRLEDMKEFYADVPDGMKIVMRPIKK